MTHAPSMVVVIGSDNDTENVALYGDPQSLGWSEPVRHLGDFLARLGLRDRDRIRTAIAAGTASRLTVKIVGAPGAVITILPASSGVSGCSLLVEADHRADTVPRRLDRPSLLRAIEAGEFSPVFQPIHRVNDQADICGFEALARWHGPAREGLGPEEFIPSLRGAGLMLPFGRLIRNLAVERFAGAGLGEALVLSVNITAEDLHTRAILAETEALLTGSSLRPQTLRLEITESEFIGESTAISETLAALKSLGVSLALDDFGSGWSSLTWLERFPVDVVKIDRHFLLQHEVSEASRKIAASIITLAHDLDIAVVAEGVETRATYEWLKDLGCDMAQGYWLSLPVEGAQIHRSVREYSGLSGEV